MAGFLFFQGKEKLFAYLAQLAVVLFKNCEAALDGQGVPGVRFYTILNLVVVSCLSLLRLIISRVCLSVGSLPLEW